MAYPVHLRSLQLKLAMTLADLDGIINVADDILVFGEGDTYEEASCDYDRRCIALMDRCMKRNIKLNPDKLKCDTVHGSRDQ